MFIENVSAVDVAQGWHYDAGENSMLIQIRDPGSNYWPTPKCKFREVHQFEFADVDEDDELKNLGCSQEQADQLVKLLEHARENSMNVIVHCLAGICRSGAVAEIGAIMGFTDTEKYRQPNMMVKSKMLSALGLTYDKSLIIQA